MVKLRGINVWPEAVGDIALEIDGVAPDYFVRAVRENNRDEMVVAVVSDRPPRDFDAIRDAIEARLKDRLGVRIRAEVVAPGALDVFTQAGVAPKLKRFRDDRNG